MRKFFSALTGKKPKDELVEMEEDYVELDSNPVHQSTGDAKVIIRRYVIEDFSDVKEILDGIRNGDTVAIVNIRPLKDKDMIELKRAINKLKKTTDATKGDIAGFGDDYIIIAPDFAQIYRPPVEE